MRRMNTVVLGGGGGTSSSGITIGTTTITSGTDTRVLFDDGGKVGESAGLTYVKGTGTLSATNVTVTTTLTSPTLTTAAGVAEAISSTAPAAAASTTAGPAITVTAGNAIAGTANNGAAAGGSITITSGNAARRVSGDANGGDINLTPGTGIGAGTTGNVVVTTGELVVPNATVARPGLTFAAGTGTSGFYARSGATWTYATGGAAKWEINPGSTTLLLDSAWGYDFGSVGASLGSGISQASAGVVRATVGGGSGAVSGDFQAGLSKLTVGTMTKNGDSLIRRTITRFDWTNAMVQALGGGTAGDIAVCTLPAKTIVVNAYVVILTAAGTVATLTVAVGRVAAAYIDYIVASDAKAAANTVYGAAAIDRGTNLTGFDLPSFTGTTVVNAHFIASAALNTVTTSTGSVYLETALLP